MARNRNQLSDQLSKFPCEMLDQQCTESHLGKLVRRINLETMLLIAPNLGLTDVEVDDIRDSWPRKPALQRQQMLKRSRATYRTMVTALFEAGRVDIIDDLSTLVSTTDPQGGGHVPQGGVHLPQGDAHIPQGGVRSGSAQGTHSQTEGNSLSLHLIPEVKHRMGVNSLHSQGLNGRGISIIILDGGILQDISEFKDKPAPIVYHGEPFPTFHGTACAVLAGGAHKGIAPGAFLTVYQVSHVGRVDENKVIKYLRDLVERKEKGHIIDIISMSFGFDKANPDIIKYIDKLTSLGVVCVAACGNGGLYQKVLAFPARHNNVISVGACKPLGDLCDSNPRVNVDVYAPGEDIEILQVQSQPLRFSGSSAATPVVAGIIALMLQCANRLTEKNVKDLIRRADTLQSLFAYDLLERGQRLLYPYELLQKWWRNPHEIEKTIKKYHS